MVRPTGPRIVAHKATGSDSWPMSPTDRQIPTVPKISSEQMLTAVVTLAKGDADDLIEMVTGHTLEELQQMRGDIDDERQ